MNKGITWHPELDHLLNGDPALLNEVKTSFLMVQPEERAEDRFVNVMPKFEVHFQVDEDAVFITDVFRKNGLDPLLLLFDIDGTLLTSSGFAKTAFEKALLRNFGTAGDINGFSWSGKLDPIIMRELMRGAGIPEDTITASLPKTLADYEAILDATLPAEKVVIRPGVVEILKEIKTYEDLLCSLCTGNTPGGARIKLTRGNLYHYFSTGAFGTDGAARSELPPIGLRRAQRWWGLAVDASKVFVIGDSPEDVKCAQASHYHSVAIASGWHPMEELASHKPELLLEDLEKGREAFWRFLASAHAPR
jgi:phosphoglycolate phosphatase-like HAD superfamily hydrolase